MRSPIGNGRPFRLVSTVAVLGLAAIASPAVAGASRGMSRSSWNFVTAILWVGLSQAGEAAASGAAVGGAFNGWLVKAAASLVATSRSTATASLARSV